ncbi:MAG: gluconate 2-dehydrogenase subunit 3 family protein [Terriglobia bacterium]
MSDPKPLNPIEDPSRRKAIQQLALAVTAVAGSQVNLEAAQHVHQQAKEEKKASGSYQPKFFNDHEYTTLSRLTELIVPADEVSGSAKDAGAPEYIDLLCSQNPVLANIYTGGLAWIDGEMKQSSNVPFIEAKPEQQTALLDSLAELERQNKDYKQRGLSYEGTVHYIGLGSYGIQPPSDLGPGVFFFQWLRKMTVDGFYTSEIGIKDVNYKGNAVISEFEVPQQCIDYALKRSPFGKS